MDEAKFGSARQPQRHADVPVGTRVRITSWWDDRCPLNLVGRSCEQGIDVGRSVPTYCRLAQLELCRHLPLGQTHRTGTDEVGVDPGALGVRAHRASGGHAPQSDRATQRTRWRYLHRSDLLPLGADSPCPVPFTSAPRTPVRIPTRLVQ